MKTTPAKTTPVRTARVTRAKAAPAPRPKSSLTRAETTKLLMQAQEAYNYQTALRNIEPGDTFDTWRRDQVMDAVGRAGISKIGRTQWRTVFAHFLILAGRDDEAYAALTTTGPKRDHGHTADNYEASEALVYKLREALAHHAEVALAPGIDHIHPGWLLAAARQRTSKSTLTWDTMAERISPSTLVGLLSHLRNHIARREGRESDRRAKRSYPCKPDASTLHEDGRDPF